MIAGALAEFPPPYLDAAQVAGASGWTIAKCIEFPLLRRSMASAFAYAVAIPLADLTGVIAIGRGRVVTFPVAIYRMLGFRSFHAALALSCVYIGFVFLLFAIIDFGSADRYRLMR